jgi:hypothetical protein
MRFWSAHFAVAATLGLWATARADNPTGSAGFVVTVATPRLSSFSGPECRSAKPPTVSFTWSTTAPPAPNETEEVFVSSAMDCSTNVLGLVPQRPRASASSAFPSDATESLNASQLFGALIMSMPTTPATDTCGGTAGVETDAFVCARLTRPDLATPLLAVAKIHLDSVAPSPPTNVVATPLDAAILVTWKMPTPAAGTARFKLYVTPSTGNEIVAASEGALNLTAQITGLTDGVTYRVAVSALDDAGETGNESARSEPAQVTPQQAEDFWTRYQRLGGQARGGCASSEVPLWGLVVAILVLARRRRSRLLLGVGVVSCLVSLPARAQSAGLEKPSFLRLTLQLRGAAFKPNVDSEKSLTGQPYRDIFGNGRQFMWGGEVGVGLATRLGTFGVTAGAHTWKVSGRGRLAAGGDVQSADTISLSLIPISVAVVWRLSFLHEKYLIPVIPFARLGYGWVSWNTSRDGASQGSVSGWAQGMEYGGGVQVVLDGGDDGASASMLRNYGLRSTSLFADYTVVRWASTTGLNLGGGMIGFGIVIEL